LFAAFLFCFSKSDILINGDFGPRQTPADRPANTAAKNENINVTDEIPNRVAPNAKSTV
jgi:hypothetical protein